MRDVTLVIATVVVGLGLVMIVWRELADAEERRRVGPLRDMAEVFLPIVATVALLVWVWVNRAG